MRHCGLVNQQNGNPVAYRVDAATAGAAERVLIRGERNWLAALRHRADHSIEELFDDHRKYCNAATNTIPISCWLLASSSWLLAYHGVRKRRHSNIASAVQK